MISDSPLALFILVQILLFILWYDIKYGGENYDS